MIKEDTELVARYNRKLYTYFDKSEDAKNIFKDLNKSPKL